MPRPRLKDDEKRFREAMAKPGTTPEQAAKIARVHPKQVRLFTQRLAAYRPSRKEKAAALQPAKPAAAVAEQKPKSESKE